MQTRFLGKYSMKYSTKRNNDVIVRFVRGSIPLTSTI